MPRKAQAPLSSRFYAVRVECFGLTEGYVRRRVVEAQAVYDVARYEHLTSVVYELEAQEFVLEAQAGLAGVVAGARLVLELHHITQLSTVPLR